MSTEERRLQDKLNEMHITNIKAKDVIRSSGPDDFLRSWGVSEENTNIIMNFLHGRWQIKYMELPISRDIKEYYEKQNIEFSDSEKATIIWNSFWTLDENCKNY